MSGTSVLSWDEYEELLKPLTKELSDAARWIQETDQRVVIVFEGRDTAGKGGSIDVFSRTLNPRQCKIVALSAPSERERGQWYFQRYMEHLPTRGELTLFDRSWYNRAGVEKVMGYCSEEDTAAFLKAVPDFERHLVETGFSCSNIGCASIRTSRRSGSGTGWRIPVGGGNFPPSISNPGPDTTNIPRHANGCSRRLIPNGRPGR